MVEVVVSHLAPLVRLDKCLRLKAVWGEGPLGSNDMLSRPEYPASARKCSSDVDTALH